MQFPSIRKSVPSIFIIGIVFQVVAAWLSYENYGASYSSLLWIIMVATNLVLIALFSNKLRNILFALWVLLFVGIVPQQFYTEYKRMRIKDESNSILAYLENKKEQTGVFPKNLSGYEYQDVTTKNYIVYENKGNADYQLRYHTGAPASAMHFYNYKDGGGWQFCDD